MKNQLSLAVILTISTVLFTSCAVVGGIFKAGFWTAIILVALVVIAIIFLVRKMGGRRP